MKFSAAETEFFAVARIDRNDPAEFTVLANISPGLFDGPEAATLILAADPTGSESDPPFFFLEEGERTRHIALQQGKTIPLAIDRRRVDARFAEARNGVFEVGGAIRRSFSGIGPAEGTMRLRLRIEPWPPEARIIEWCDLVDLDALSADDADLLIGTLTIHGVPASEDGGPSCRLRLVALSTGPDGRLPVPPVRLRALGDTEDTAWRDTDVGIEAGPDGATFEIGFSREDVRRLLRQMEPDPSGQCSLILHIGLRCIIIDDHGRPAPFRDEVRPVLLKANRNGALARRLDVALGQETRGERLLADGFAVAFATPVSAVWRKENETLLNFLSSSVLRFALDEEPERMRLRLSARLRQADKPEHRCPQRVFTDKSGRIDVPLMDLLPTSVFDQPGGPWAGDWLCRVEGTLDLSEAEGQSHPVAIELVLRLSRQTDGWGIAVDSDASATAIRIGRMDGSASLDLRLDRPATETGKDKEVGAHPGLRLLRDPLSLRDLGGLGSPTAKPGSLDERLSVLGEWTVPMSLLLQARGDAETASFRRMWLDGLAEPTLALAVPSDLGAAERDAFRAAGSGFLSAFACDDGAVTLVPRTLAAAHSGIAAFLNEEINATASGRYVFVVVDIGSSVSEAAVVEAELSDGTLRAWDVHSRLAFAVGADALDRLLAGRLAALLDLAGERRGIAETFDIFADLPVSQDEIDDRTDDRSPGFVFLREFSAARTRFAERSRNEDNVFRMKVGERRTSGEAGEAWPVALKRRLALQDFFIDGHDGARLLLAGNDIVLDVPQSLFAADSAISAVIALLGRHIPGMAYSAAKRLCETNSGRAGPILLVSARGALWPSLFEAIVTTAGDAHGRSGISPSAEAMANAIVKGTLDLARDPALLTRDRDFDELALLLMRAGKPVDIRYLPDSRKARGEVILSLSGDFALVRAAPGLDADRVAFFADRLPAATGDRFGIRPWIFDTARFSLRFSKKQKVAFRWERHDEGLVVRIKSQDMDGPLSWTSGLRSGVDR